MRTVHSAAARHCSPVDSREEEEGKEASRGPGTPRCDQLLPTASVPSCEKGATGGGVEGTGCVVEGTEGSGGY